MQEIISVTNDKGGVGKTTTAVNIAVGLGSKSYGKKVLVIDLDAQFDASKLLGWKLEYENNGLPTIFTSLSKGTGITAYESSYENVWVVPGSPKLNDVEGFLRSRDVAVTALKECMQESISFADGKKGSIDDFDFVFIDCPPSMSLITKNALATATSILIPIQLEALSVENLGGILEAYTKIKKSVNPNLSIKGIVRCMENKQLKLSKELNIALGEQLSEYLCKTGIPRSTKVPTSQVEHNVTIDSDPWCEPSLRYRELIKELFA